MKKKLILAGFGILLYTNVSAQIIPVIQNGNMEEWKEGKPFPKEWGTFYNIEKEGIFGQSTDGHSGKYAIQASFAPQKEFDNRRFYTVPFNIEAGKYQVKLFLKGSGDIRFIALHKNGTNAAGKNSSSNVVGTSPIGKIQAKDWKDYTLDFHIIDADSYQLTICINSADKLLIDDVVINKSM